MPSGSNFMSEANKVGTHGSCVRGSKSQCINNKFGHFDISFATRHNQCWALRQAQ